MWLIFAGLTLFKEDSYELCVALGDYMEKNELHIRKNENLSYTVFTDLKSRFDSLYTFNKQHIQLIELPLAVSTIQDSWSKEQRAVYNECLQSFLWLLDSRIGRKTKRGIGAR